MSTVQKSHGIQGRLLSLLVIPAGITLWVLLWRAGFMASIVSFGIAYGALWLFQAGAKEAPSRSDAYFLVGVIVVAVIASFLGGMISDGWYAWHNEFDEAAGFFSGDFWSFMTANLLEPGLWSSYTVDILLSLVFAALGAGGLIKDLLSPAEVEVAETTGQA